MFGEFSIVIAENLIENISEQDILLELEKYFSNKMIGCITYILKIKKYLYPVVCVVDFINKVIWVYKHKNEVAFFINPNTEDKFIIILD